MIIQKQKEFETIEETLGEYQKVFIAGCADCATACKTGGEEELAAMTSKLEELGKTVTGVMVYDTACMLGEVRKKCAEAQEQIDAADAVLVLCCGSGVQTLGDYLDTKPVVPGVDALFIGETIRAGKYVETCQSCGECVLEMTDGICPQTRCAKGLLNGPCGGYKDGKCEVDPDKDCAWVLIYERLKARGHVDKIRKIMGPKDHSAQHRPRRHQWERPKKVVPTTDD
jgi:methylene-tetrahydrofolate reductase-like protein